MSPAASGSVSLPSLAELLATDPSASPSMVTNQLPGRPCDAVQPPLDHSPRAPSTHPSAPPSSSVVGWNAVNHADASSRNGDKPPAAEAEAEAHQPQQPQHHLVLLQHDHTPNIPSAPAATSAPRVLRGPQQRAPKDSGPAYRQDSTSSTKPSVAHYHPARPSDVRPAAIHPSTPPSPAPSPTLDSPDRAQCPIPSAPWLANHQEQGPIHSTTGPSEFLPSSGVPHASVAHGPRLVSEGSDHHDPATRSSTSHLPSGQSPTQVDDKSSADVMPPPQVPTHCSTAPVSDTHSPSDGPFAEASQSEMASRHAQQQEEAQFRDTNSSVHFDPTQDESIQPGDSVITRHCEICNRPFVWPFDFSKSRQSGPSETHTQYNQANSELIAFLRDHRRRLDEAFDRWRVEHQPCSPSLADSDHGTEARSSASLNGKRKSGAVFDDSQISSKLRRVSFDSLSPKLCQSTPPPEPGSASALEGLASTGNSKIYPFDSDGVTVYLREPVARVLNLPAVPAQPRETPPKDHHNMWYDTSRGDANAQSKNGAEQQKDKLAGSNEKEGEYQEHG